MPARNLTDWETFTFAVFLAYGLSGLAWFWQLWELVRDGHRHDPYFTAWGYRFTPAGALITVAVACLAIPIGLAVNWWITLDERDFFRKYPPRPRPELQRPSDRARQRP